jgi:hypothetical protein
MFAVVLLTRTCLRIQLNHWRQFAELSGETDRTFAPISVDPINTSASILTHTVHAIVFIVSAVIARPSERTNALMMAIVVNTSRAVFARIVFFSAEIDFFLAIISTKSWLTFTPIRLDLVNTSGVVFALVRNAVIDISLTAIAFKTFRKKFFFKKIIFHFQK